MLQRIRTRFAPSPTGGLHMGGVRTALYSYLFAKKHGGDFILRIEDTDQSRYVEGAEEYIINSLRWCGIGIDEGVSVGGPHAPYRQSERKELYKKYAVQLIESGHAYYAFDTADEIEKMRDRLKAEGKNSQQYDSSSRMAMRNSLSLGADEVKKLLSENTAHVVRLKVTAGEEIYFDDIIRGKVTVNSSLVDDKVLLKSDGMPTYHLAHIVDDYLMEISHAIRGEEWLPSAPAHILIYRHLGWESKMPRYAHLPLILKPDGNGKLSKRDKSGLPMFPLNWFDPRDKESFTGYKESGYLPEAFVNMLAFLGWNPGTEQELFLMQELIDNFSLERVHKGGAKFDPEKTKWFNQQHIRLKSNAELAEIFIPVVEQKLNELKINFTPARGDLKTHTEKVCGLLKEKMHLLTEFWTMANYFYISPLGYDQSVISKKWNDNAKMFFLSLAENFTNVSDFNAAVLEQTFKTTAEKLSINPGSVMQLFRVLLSGMAIGPALFEIAEVLGKEETCQRLKKGANSISA